MIGPAGAPRARPAEAPPAPWSRTRGAPRARPAGAPPAPWSRTRGAHRARPAGAPPAPWSRTRGAHRARPAGAPPAPASRAGGAKAGWLQPPPCSTVSGSMALTTRVWSAGKFFVLAGALLATFVLFFAASMRIALRTREVVVPEPHRADRQRRDAPPQRRRAHVQGRGDPPNRPEDPHGTGRGPGAPGGDDDPQPTHGEGLAERRADRVHRAAPRGRVRADRADPRADGLAPPRLGRGDPVGGRRGGGRHRAEPAAPEPCGVGRPAGQPGRARPDRT